MVAMRALTASITPCPRELDEAVWMPVDQFLDPKGNILNRVPLCLALGRPLPDDYKPAVNAAKSGADGDGWHPWHWSEVAMPSRVNPSKVLRVYHGTAPVADA